MLAPITIATIIIIITTTTNIPTPTPALKIPAIALQELKVERNNTREINFIKFFIIR